MKHLNSYSASNTVPPLGRRPFLGRLAAGAAAIAVAPGRARGQQRAAASFGVTMTASAFLDTVGVGAHWEYPNSVYGVHARALSDALVDARIRHVRGYDPVISAALAERGVLATLVAGPEVGDPEQIADTVQRANRARRVIDAVEGPNEADIFWSRNGHSYRGEGFPSGVLRYQRELYRTLKARLATADVHVIGPSLGGTYDPGAGKPNPLPPGSLADAVDFGNFHPYPFGGNSFSVPFPYGGIERYYWHGNFPSVNLGEFPYNRLVYAPPFGARPMVATETGYFTGPQGVSEAVHARYLPRLLAEYARLGVRRTYLYELADMSAVPGVEGMHGHFGLMRPNALPKPAYTALRGLLRVVSADADGEIVGSAPEFSVDLEMPPGYDRAQYVHGLLLRKPRGQALLLLWHEVASADASTTPPREIAVPAGRAIIVLPPDVVATAWHDYDASWNFVGTAVAPDIRRLTVPLRAQIVAVALQGMT